MPDIGVLDSGWGAGDRLTPPQSKETRWTVLSSTGAEVKRAAAKVTWPTLDKRDKKQSHSAQNSCNQESVTIMSFFFFLPETHTHRLHDRKQRKNSFAESPFFLGSASPFAVNRGAKLNSTNTKGLCSRPGSVSAS